MTDTGTKEKMVFSFNRWLSRDMDDGDMVRELPVVRTGKPIPICKFTGCMPSSGYVNEKYKITHWWQRLRRLSLFNRILTLKASVKDLDILIIPNG